jgi:hypothetical protein
MEPRRQPRAETTSPGKEFLSRTARLPLWRQLLVAAVIAPGCGLNILGRPANRR